MNFNKEFPVPVDILAEIDMQIAFGLLSLKDTRDIVADLISALRLIDDESKHHYTGCEPGPMKRMPPELREAILRARKVLSRIATKDNNP